MLFHLFFSAGQDLPISYVDLMLIALRGFQVILFSWNFSSDFHKEAGLISPYVSHQAAVLSEFFSLLTDSRNLCRQQESLRAKLL